MSAPTPVLDVANRVMACFSALGGLSNTWMEYLISPKFDRQPELRNKIFCIYVNGLVDACLEFDSRLHELAHKARQAGSERAVYYVEMLKAYYSGAVDMLSIFERHEMVFLLETRHQFVHGHWREIHREARDVRYVKNRKLVTDKKVEKAAFDALHRQAFRTPEDTDDSVIEGLRERFYRHKTLFWSVNERFRQPQAHVLIQKDILNPRPEGPDVVAVFHPDGYWKTMEVNPACMATLLDVRKRLLFGRGRIDPVTKGTRPRIAFPVPRVIRDLLTRGGGWE